jgi:4TM region of pyridine nucleotide transhydrogenase, mitoch
MLAAFAGWVIISGVPAILHTPLMSGSNFVHGIVKVGEMFALLNASSVQEQVIGFFAVLLGGSKVSKRRSAPSVADTTSWARSAHGPFVRRMPGVAGRTPDQASTE